MNTQDKISAYNEHMAKQIFGKAMTLRMPATEYHRKVEKVIRENSDLFATIYISKSDVGEKFIATVESLIDG